MHAKMAKVPPTTAATSKERGTTRTDPAIALTTES